MSEIKKIIQKIINNESLDFEQAISLYQNADLLTLGQLADPKKRALHPEKIVTFVVDRNINYTNVCVSGCAFCAFYRSPESSEAYVISEAKLKDKIQETIQMGGTQILLQGGMNPNLDLNYYLKLLKFIKKNFSIHIHGFSPPEIVFMSEKSGMSISSVIKKLMEAGLDSIPGGGAEILSEQIRTKISPNKCPASQWLEVMKIAHELGLKSSATMMFGHIESPEHIIKHLFKIKDLQDQTNGFTAFIPWTFQSKNTRISVKETSAAQYLKVLALSRIILDNVPNIQASWVTQADKIAQVSLAFGANDFGSTMIEENVVAAAGVKFKLPKEEIIRLIQDAGYKAVQRDFFYNHIKEFKKSSNRVQI